MMGGANFRLSFSLGDTIPHLTGCRVWFFSGYLSRASLGTGGTPNLQPATRQLALAFDQAGVDILELGVPFSDPLADGLVNQLAAQRGLESGTTPPKVLETVAAIRRESQIPIVLYVYFNLIHHYGPEKFIH